MNRSSIPELLDTNFQLRSLSLRDAQQWLDLVSLPEIKDCTSWNMSSLETMRAHIDAHLDSSADAPVRFVVESKSGQFAGTIGLHSRSQRDRRAEIAYELHPSFWGQGLATACVKAMSLWSFENLELIRLQATVLITNQASRRVLEKCGFHTEGELRAYRIVHDVPRDYAMLAQIKLGTI